MLKKYELFEKIKGEVLKKNFDVAINSLEKFLDDKEYKIQASFELAKIYFEQNKYDKAEDYLRNIIYLQEKQNLILNESFLMLIKIYKFQNKKQDLLLIIKKIIDCKYDEIYFVDEIYDVIDIFFMKHFVVYEYDGSIKELFDWFQLIKYFIPNNSKSLLCLVHISNFFGFYDFTKSLIKDDIINNECNEYYKNAFLNELEIAEKKVVLKSKPRSLWLTLSNKCNLHCFMCKTHLLREWFLSEQDLEYIYSCFPYLEYIVWWGGEPTVIDGFKRVLLDALKYPNIKHRIITNGQYLPDDLVDIILRHNIEIVFSVDYVDKERYEKARKGARFDLLISNIKKLSGKIKKELFKINVVLNKENQKSIQDIVEFGKNYGCGNISFIPISGIDNKNLKPLVETENKTKDDDKKNISINNAVYILDKNNKPYETFCCNENNDGNNDSINNIEISKEKDIDIKNNNSIQEKEKNIKNINIENNIYRHVRHIEKASECFYKINRKEIDEIIDRVEHKYIGDFVYNKIECKENKAIKQIRKDKLNYENTLKQNYDKFCNIPWTQMSIDYVQDIVPDPVCTCFYKIGLNLQNFCLLSDVRNSKEMQELRSRMLNIKKCSVNCPKALNL